MAEFQAITTQEEFDSRIKDRLERERNTAAANAKKEFETKLAELESLKTEKETWTTEKAAFEASVKEKTDNIASLTAQLSAEQTKVKGFEKENLKRKVAQDAGLPDTLAGRIQGETEEEMKEDAKSLALVFKANNNKGIPMANLDDKSGNQDEKKAAYKKMLQEMKGE